ncbi:hypothetical protein OAO99_04230 [Candidatus Pelagibacter sp.]|jgi:hypothetical protein|nr:hypothetical protein [Candidatus Pelagibacter sp.]
MVKNLINRLKFFFKRRFDQNLILNANTHFVRARKNYESVKKLNDLEFKVFSQNGEDGIIDYLIYSLNINKLKFVEIGVGDYTECNTRFLINSYPFKGLLCDINSKLNDNLKYTFDTHRGSIKVFNNYVNSSNILEILKSNNFHKKLNLFSIDIDSMDYYVIEKLPNEISDIFIAEYNQNFGPNLEVTVPHLDQFDRHKYHYSGQCYGLSLRALINLMKKKGYVFLGCNVECCNAFFILESKKDLIKLSFPDENDLTSYFNDYVCDVRDKNGKILNISINERLEYIKDCNIIDLSNNNIKVKKISDLIIK